MEQAIAEKPESLYTRTSLLLILITCISYIGLGFLLPLRALYARDIGATTAEIGFMASAPLLTGVLAAPLVGRLSDRIGYSIILWVGLLAHALIILAYIPNHSPLGLIGLRALEGISSLAIMPSARALMNSTAPSNRQGEALGLLSSATTAGILLGPAAGTLLAGWIGFTPAFLCAGIALAISALVSFLLLPKQPKPPEQATEERARFTDALTSPLIFTYLLSFLLYVPQGVATAVWALYMVDRGASLPLVGLSFTAFALPGLVVAPAIGRFSDRNGRYWPLLLGFALSGAIYALYGLPLAPIPIILISIAEGIAATIARSALDGLLADLIPPDMRGRAQANFSASGTAGVFVGAISAGFLYAFAPGVPFVIEGVLLFAVAAALLLPFCVRIVRHADRARMAG